MLGLLNAVQYAFLEVFGSQGTSGSGTGGGVAVHPGCGSGPFVAEGYHNVSIRKIAERIEYSPAAIYSYFPSKDDIFFALAEEGFRILFTPPRARRGRLDGDLLKTIRRAFWRVYEFSKSHPEYFALMFLDRTVPQISQNWERFEFVRDMKAQLGAGIQRAIDAGLFRPAPTPTLSSASSSPRPRARRSPACADAWRRGKTRTRSPATRSKRRSRVCAPGFPRHLFPCTVRSHCPKQLSEAGMTRRRFVLFVPGIALILSGALLAAGCSTAAETAPEATKAPDARHLDRRGRKPVNQSLSPSDGLAHGGRPGGSQRRNRRPGH